MNLNHIELSKLTVSSANMRAKHKDRDVADLIPSILARGVLVPLLVRPSSEPDMYEIIAGRRRFHAARAVAESRGETMTLPCAIVEPGDDVAALEASLIENIARLDADEVTQWETFAQLVRRGKSVEHIAATFGLSDAVVRRVLALGNLLPRIRTLYRTEQIDASTVRQLTMATTAQQREWLTLYDSPDNHAPSGRVLKEWLFGGAAIPTSAAIFDLADYTAPVITDLFGEHRYFSDSALFWTLQHKAIEAKRQAYVADGWAEVVVLEDGRWFDRWAFEKRGRAKGGRVYIVVGEQGSVEIHEGYLPRKEAQGLDRADSPAPSAPRPELTSPLRRYVDLHRHAAVRAKLLDHPWIALRLIMANVIAGSPLWKVSCERQRADKPETERSIMNSRAEAAFGAVRNAALVLLGLDPESNNLSDRTDTSLEAVFDTLMHLSNAELLGLVSLVMGETLEAGSDIVETLGCLLHIDMGEMWEADEAFFALLRDRKIVGLLVEEIAGSKVASGNVGVPAKVLKAILADCLAGRNGRVKAEGWTPRWLRFPQGSYVEGPATSSVDEPITPSDRAEPENIDPFVPDEQAA